MTWKVNSVDGLEEVVKNLLEVAGDRRKIAVYGEMGAGKTTFIRVFCRYLGTRDAAASPTFSLVNTYHYHNKEGQEALIHHLDLYRINRIEETLDFGIEEYLSDPYFCLIEWPEIIEPLLPEEVVKIRIEADEDSSRKIVFL